MTRALASEGNNLILLDSLSDYYSIDLKRERERRLLKDFNLSVNRIDLTDPRRLDSLFLKNMPDTVIHLAAQPGIRLGFDEYHRYIKDNLVSFSNLLTIAAKNEIPNFLYASSSSVYGNTAQPLLNEKIPGIKPISFYGATKLSNEILAETMSEITNTKFRGMRFFTVYGPLGRPDMSYWKIMDAILNGSEFRVFGDGTKVRDFTFVDDVVNSILDLARELHSRNGKYADVVNVGGGKPASVNDLIRGINMISGRELKIKNLENARGDVNSTNADTDYLTSLTGKFPRISLDAGLEKTWNWFSSLEDREVKSWRFK